MFPPASLEAILRAAGWFPGRRTALPPDIPVAHPAAAILSSLSGLVILEAEPEEDGIRYQLVCFEARPTDGAVERWERELNTRLVGIGQTQSRHNDLYIDGRGRLFGGGIDDTFCFEGADFEDAMHRLRNHVRVRPMLLPDEASVVLYGKCFVHGDPEVLTAAMLRDEESARPFG